MTTRIQNPERFMEQFDTSIHPEDIHLNPQQQESSWRVFNFYDLDQNGEISKDELKNVLKSFRASINDLELNAFFEQYDIDASNYIDFNEFLEIIKYKLAQDANTLATSKTMSYFFEKKDLEVLIQYLDIVPFKKGENLPFLGQGAEETVLIIGNESEKSSEDSSIPVFTSTNHKHQIAESSGIAIRMQEEKLCELVQKYPLIALKLNQALNSRLSSIMLKYV